MRVCSCHKIQLDEILGKATGHADNYEIDVQRSCPCPHLKRDTNIVLYPHLYLYVNRSTKCLGHGHEQEYHS